MPSDISIWRLLSTCHAMLRKRMHGNRIALKFILSTVLMSLAMAGLLAAFQLYLDYQRDVNSIHARLHDIGKSSVGALSTAVWNVNESNVHLLLEGLMNMPDIAYVEVRGDPLAPIASGKFPKGPVLTATYPLFVRGPAMPMQVGELRVVATLAPARTALWLGIGEVIKNELIKTLFIALGMLLLFSLLVSRRLVALSAFARNFNIDSLHRPLRLERPPHLLSARDELDDVAQALDRMRESLRQELGGRQQALQALQKSEERFELAMRGANDGLWDWDLRQRKIYFSPRWKAMLGYAPDEIPNNLGAWQALLHPDDLPLAKRAGLDYLVRNKQMFECRYRMRHKAGHFIWILSRGFALRDEHGRAMRFVGTHVDITSLAEAEATITKLSRAIEQSPIAMAIADRHGRIEYVNRKLSELAGTPVEQLQGTRAHALPLLQAGSAADHASLWTAYAAGTSWSTEMPVQDAATSVRWQRLSISPIRSGTSTVTDMMLIWEDITDRHLHEQQLFMQANFDNLTRLPNRTLANDRLAQALGPARRNQEKVAVVFMDLDRFKYINDSMGHAAGDELLCEVARRLQKAMREGHTVARFGGDEFLIILPGITDLKQVESIMDRILHALNEPVKVANTSVVVTGSLGVSVFPDDGTEPGALIQHADAAMYHAKKAGKNTYSFFMSSFNNEANEWVRMETELRFALERDQLSLNYQPLIDLKTGEIIGAEALLRWHSAKLGQVPPSVFIELAEETGLIRPIGEWVIASVCRQIEQWNRQFGFKGYVAVNISSKEFQGERLIKHLSSCLTRYQLKPQQIELEITERTLLDNGAHVAQTLEQFDRLGIALTIDDFGTGYSSLSYLHRFPFKVLKIDQSFIKNLGSSERDAALVRGIISLTHNLGMRVVAEGVETDQHLKFLAEENCDYGQGYLFAKPVSGRQFEAFLQRVKQEPLTALASFPMPVNTDVSEG